MDDIEFLCMCSAYKTVATFSFLHKYSTLHKEFINYVKTKIPPEELDHLSKEMYIEMLSKEALKYHLSKMRESIEKLKKSRGELVVCPCSSDKVFAAISLKRHIATKNHKKWLEYRKPIRLTHAAAFTLIAEIETLSVEYIVHNFEKMQKKFKSMRTNQLYSFIKC